MKLNASKVLALIAAALFLLAAFDVSFGPAAFVPLGLALLAAAVVLSP